MLAVLAGALMLAESTGPPEPPREFRGVWVATVDNIDWPSRPGLSTADQKSELRHLLRTVAKAHFNAIVFQVRPSADALYASRLEPSSWYLTGKQGDKVSFDPLEYAVEEGHKLGLEVHAWFNPFRCGHPAQKGPYCETHVSKTHPDWVRTYGRYQWLDPGVPEARDHSLKVVMDVVDRYDIDGIHIDDYFYPYPEKDQSFPDDESYSRYVASGGSLPRTDWRRANIDNFVERLYSNTKRRKPWVKVGISPFGIFRPDVPKGIKAGLDQYAELYADCEKWLKEGWCDYMAPQLYWKVASKGQPFEPLLKWWLGASSKGRYVWPGLYTGQLATNGGNWPAAEIGDQIRISRELSRTPGQVHFSAKAILADWKDIAATLAKGQYSKEAGVPALPWIAGGVPKTPKAEIKAGELVWEQPQGVLFFETWLLEGNKWRMASYSSETTFKLPKGGPDKAAVVAVSRTGRRSEPGVVTLEPAAR
ncbi:MAG: family 10 glycosylhydrolase [Armatimonadetes bacterium]|nr:family 10 glycosylhydrolase [Armatimonadota bacterium]